MNAVARASTWSLLARWTVSRIRLTRRTPRAAFFTFVFPLVFLILFEAANGNGTVVVNGNTVNYSQYVTPAIGVFGVATACYTGVIFTVANAREQGVLKRVRSTPLPGWIWIAAVLLAAVLMGVASVTLMFAISIPAFGVQIYWQTLPAAIFTIILGAISLAAVGLAVAGFVRRADAAPVVANLTLLPLSFISGVFYPIDKEPEWLQQIANIFPLSHLASAFTACFDPATTGSGFAPRDLAVLAVWAIIGLRVATKRFRWEPSDSSGRVSWWSLAGG